PIEGAYQIDARFNYSGEVIPASFNVSVQSPKSIGSSSRGLPSEFYFVAGVFFVIALVAVAIVQKFVKRK
ncbi:MAG: hypothetical protein Q8R15_01150, partial [Candidatus Micrarchaeota archaeon]|nr:hypothetical protein [Candidatus Micrarchaeota archaeon]